RPLVVTMEEAFIRKGGLDSLVSGVVMRHGLGMPVRSFGYRDAYVTTGSNREQLAGENQIGDEDIMNVFLSA
ncbi:MAG: hypothetical protein JXA71_12220, partial [Chitinispirillaceae bacterium]|nr:hypothetical protein [Chitinispirillaceae bacterium]